MYEQKTIEERLDAIEKKLKELERQMDEKVNSQTMNKTISDLRFAIKNHRI